jgi:mediator of RNA polymerase II transcription subunit 6
MIMADRHAFEERLRSMTGIEYMVVDGPDPRKPDANVNPVWTIRKHRREKEPGQPDRVTVLGTYFAIGENIYQAPSLYDILKNGLDLVTLEVKDLFDEAHKMQHFLPSEGYSYLQHGTRKSAAVDSAATSRAGTPDLDSAMAQLDQLDKASEEDSFATRDDDALLYNSLLRTNRFVDEYMDENPLQGEPGNFFFTSTTEHIRAQAKKAQDAVVAAEAGKQTSSRPSSAGNTPQPPPPLKTEGLPRKGSKAPLSGIVKAKRRKSKAPGSPLNQPSPP